MYVDIIFFHIEN